MGGNGMVFAVTYGLREYAVKKTPFRNWEFQIHKRLKQLNIIELSCLMFGPPQPQYQRRYYSYHFMPRVTGDLARMVTDRRDLVMTSLTSKYHNDPLRLGSIQGNWKYILKELLKGLGYMHAMSIVHRDIKASNVLIKMLCSCDNPLTCTCSRKCSVMVADFDAALQLDSSGRLKVTPSPMDGYRSPELSQFVTCNDLGALTPTLGIKTDIWSVGLVLVRVLNGSNGPAKQLKPVVRQEILSVMPTSPLGIPTMTSNQITAVNITVILRTREVLREKTQNTKSTKATEVLKGIEKRSRQDLGIHKLRDNSNNWIQKAVKCISLCVEVDPEKRPNAQELLKHPFLY